MSFSGHSEHLSIAISCWRLSGLSSLSHARICRGSPVWSRPAQKFTPPLPELGTSKGQPDGGAADLSSLWIKGVAGNGLAGGKG